MFPRDERERERERGAIVPASIGATKFCLARQVPSTTTTTTTRKTRKKNSSQFCDDLGYVVCVSVSRLCRLDEHGSSCDDARALSATSHGLGIGGVDPGVYPVQSGDMAHTAHTAVRLPARCSATKRRFIMTHIWGGRGDIYTKHQVYNIYT